MSQEKRVTWMVCMGLGVAMTASVFVAGRSSADPVSQKVEAQAVAIPTGAPVYQPPRRSAPRGRIGGGTRGAMAGMPRVSVLAPDHTGQTREEQPTLYWYITQGVTYPVEFTLMTDQFVRPVAEVRLASPSQEGVQAIRLADHGIRLSAGVPYRWYVAVIVNPERRSKDIVAGGVIERVELPEDIAASLARATSADVPRVYAEAGIWYDAIASLSGLIDRHPDDAALRQQRAALLDQVSLPDVSEYDRRVGGGQK